MTAQPLTGARTGAEKTPEPTGPSDVSGLSELSDLSDLSELILAGEVEDLFSHMVLWGTALICEDAGMRVRARWTGEARPRPVLATDAADPSDVARAVQEHAAVRAGERSWLRSVFVPDRKKPKGTIATLAPRTASPADETGWRELDRSRLAQIDELPSPLDGKLLQGLGYRSWWSTERDGSIRADRGCSRWEMRTRNKGTDLVADRLLPLAVDLADWPGEKILAGLVGTESDDSTASNKPESRSATGFRLPGPVDTARAWCALWALALLPVLPQVHDGAATPAFRVLPAGSAARTELLMPVSPSLLSTAQIGRLLRSADLVDAANDDPAGASADGGPVSEEIRRRSSRERLRVQGALGIMRFPIQVVGSASAPERQALSGKLLRL